MPTENDPADAVRLRAVGARLAGEPVISCFIGTYDFRAVEDSRLSDRNRASGAPPQPQPYLRNGDSCEV